MYVHVVNPLAPGNFAEECILKLFEQFSTIKSFSGRSLHGPLIQMQLIITSGSEGSKVILLTFRSLGMCRKQNTA